jgi:hypothetical protein
MHCLHCGIDAKQIDRPCQNCGFTGVAFNIYTFMLIPELTMPEEARLDAVQIVEQMIQMQTAPRSLH